VQSAQIQTNKELKESKERLVVQSAQTKPNKELSESKERPVMQSECTKPFNKELEDSVKFRNVFNPHEKDLIEIKLRQSGMACVHMPHGIEYVSEETSRQNEGAVDEDTGLPGIRVITREDILKRIDRNKKLSPRQKAIEKDILRRKEHLVFLFIN